MKRFVLIQGNMLSLYIDGVFYGTWIWEKDNQDGLLETIENLRLHGEKF